MKDNQVITDQQNLGHKYVPIGPDLRYVGKLPVSNNNNFEEEYLLGEDRQVQRQYSSYDNCYKESIIYRKDISDGTFYRLDYSEYDMRPERQDIIVDDDEMQVDLHSRLDNLPNEAGTVLRNYDLYFHYANGNEELVSSKVVESRYIQDADKRKYIEIIKHIVPMNDNVLFENGQFNSNWAVNGLSLDNYDAYEASEIGFTNGRNWFIQNTARAESQYVTDLIQFIKDYYTVKPQLNNDNAIEVDNTASHTSEYCSSIFIPIIRGKIVNGKTVKVKQRHTQGTGGFAINFFEKESSGGSEHLTMRGNGGAGGPATTAQNTLTVSYSIPKDIDYIEIQTYNGCITEISKIQIE